MKRLITILLVALCISLNAQTSLTTAVDFTAKDCNGNTINLFDILDGGQYVLIDFFYFDCGPCQKACPKLVEAYKALGCNEHDVFFMEISYKDHDNKCKEWDEKYGVEYPTIGVDGGGLEIADAYEINSFPTVILISPRRTILIKDFPYIETAQTVIDKLTSSYSIDEHLCSDPEPEPDACGEVLYDSFSLYPNPASSYVRIASDIKERTVVKIMDVTGRCVRNIEIEDVSEAEINVEGLNKGVYFMMINDSIERLIIE